MSEQVDEETKLVSIFQKAVDVQRFERLNHNHWTRDVKPKGHCPACDRARVAWERAAAEGR